MIFLFLLSVVGGFARIGVAGVVFGYWTRWNSLCEHPKFCFFIEMKFWDGRKCVMDEISLSLFFYFFSPRYHFVPIHSSYGLLARVFEISHQFWWISR